MKENHTISRSAAIYSGREKSSYTLFISYDTEEVTTNNRTWLSRLYMNFVPIRTTIVQKRLKYVPCTPTCIFIYTHTWQLTRFACLHHSLRNSGCLNLDSFFSFRAKSWSSVITSDWNFVGTGFIPVISFNHSNEALPFENFQGDQQWMYRGQALQASI